MTSLARLMSGLVVAIAVALIPAATQAASDPNYPGPPLVSQNGPGRPLLITDARTLAVIKRKGQLVREFEATANGTEPWSVFMQHQLAFEASVGGHTPKARTQTSSAGVTPFGCIPAPCGGNSVYAVVPTTYIAQTNNYYCGPAAAWMMLYSLGLYTSAYDGAALGSPSSPALSTLANTTYLETDKWQETPWIASPGDLPMGQSLSAWWSGSYYSGYYNQLGAPSSETERSDMRYDVVLGYPLALNTTEYNGSGYHLPGHPTSGYWYSWGPIGHWIDNNGYYDNGYTVEYQDPATYFNPPRYSGWSVQADNLVNLSDINSLVQNHGIVW